MAYYLAKVLITAVLVVLVSELAKRDTLAGAVLASIPLVSVLAMVWLYIDTKDVARIATLSVNIFWLVLPSLALFLVLPGLLHRGVGFYAALAIGLGLTAAGYVALITLLRRFGAGA